MVLINDNQRETTMADDLKPDAAELDRALEAAHLPALIAAMVHMTGDAGWLRPEWTPVYKPLSPPGETGLSDDAKTEVRAKAKAAINAYPELGNRVQIEAAGKDADQVKGVDDVYNVDLSTVKFLQDVLAEVAGLFPGKFIHIGGDEAVRSAGPPVRREPRDPRPVG